MGLVRSFIETEGPLPDFITKNDFYALFTGTDVTMQFTDAAAALKLARPIQELKGSQLH